jgi:ABC-2 type transport system permease protein
MAKVLTLARREVARYFFSPLAYVLGALFLEFCALVFFFDLPGPPTGAVFEPGKEASLRGLFEMMALAMTVVAPLLTMQLFSEEYDRGTIETLMTAPVTDAQVVLGKFLGVLAFYLILLASTGVFLILMVLYGQPDPGVAAMGYAGMILVGAAFLSVGLFASSLTRYQLLAAVVGIAILVGLAGTSYLLMRFAGEPWNHLAARLNVMTYFKDFSRGILDTRAVAFFVTCTALFLFLSVKALESRRWR